MSTVIISDDFWLSILSLNFDRIRTEDRVAAFIEWKTTGVVPTQPFYKDKSSAKDDDNVVYRPYKRNQFRHCHCGFVPNGDPLIVYRILSNGDIRLVCISTHDEYFVKSKRPLFVDKYKKEFEKR
jgi:hypothetical protein